jgi:deaminated glutathione amidase
MFLAAAVQLQCTSDAEANLATAEALIRRAAGYGAKLVATPENTDFLGPHDQKVRRAEPVDGPVTARFAALAGELGIHLLLGSFAERSTEPSRCHNTSVLFGPHGQRLEVYRKLHLFDVDVGAEVSFRESATVVPGDKVVLAETSLGRIGLSICYDLRFPELYRALRDSGAQIVTIPSAFTLATGKDHWEALVRTRAIETQCWVIAPGQWGRHDDGGLRQSWGHSMIVDPWGHVVAMASDGAGLALAEIDLDKVDAVRRAIPLHTHRRIGGDGRVC